MRKWMTAITLVLMVASNLALAGVLDESRVPADAKWVAHVDITAALGSEMGKLILADLEVEGLSDKIAAAKAMFGLNPLTDFKSITAYGAGFDPDDVVAIFQLGASLGNLETFAKAAKGYQLVKQDGYDLHSWVEKDHHSKVQGKEIRKYCGIYQTADQETHLLVFSEDKKLAASALTQLNNAAKGQVPQKNLRTKPSVGSFFHLAGAGFGDAVGKHSDSIMLKAAQSLTLDIGESNNQFYLDTKLTANDKDQAKSMFEMAQGLLAMVKLAGDEKSAPIVKLAKALNLQLNGNTISCSFQYDTKEFHAVLKAMKESHHGLFDVDIEWSLLK